MEYPTFFTCNHTAQDVLELVCAQKNLTIKSVIEQVSEHPVVFKHVCELVQNEELKFTAEGHGSTRKEAGEIVAMKLLTDVLTSRELMVWNMTMQTDEEKKALLEQSSSVARTSSVDEELDKLIPKEFDYLLEHFKDPVQVLEKICEMIEAEVKFTSCENSHNAIMCNVILKADGFVRIGDGTFSQHSEQGGGTDREGARDEAARRMLKYFKSMLNFD